MLDSRAEAVRGGFGLALLRFLDPIDWIAARLVIAAMAGMVTIVAAQVFMRYVLNLSLDWAVELSRLCFVWLVFLAIPLGIKRGAHVGVGLLTDRLPSRVQDTLFRGMSALVIVLMVVVAREAVVLTHDQWDEPMATLDISVALFMLPVAIGAVHSVLHLLAGVLTGPPVKRTVATE
jgi:TRAP-type C4-dicarboxylate transport system permease small subunit